MSNLEQLIQEFCPDGVEYCKLVDVCNILYGYPCDATKFNDNRMGLPLVRIRDVLAGKTTTYTTEKVPQEYIIQAGDLLVGMDGNFHVSNWKDNCGVLCQRVCRISSKDETMVLNGFLRHYLPPTIKQIELSKPSGTVKHLLAKDINAIYVPLPPLPVQQEIVRILDTFTELTAELNEKLTAELTARKKQYEYYRSIILRSCKSAQTKTLGQICDFVRGPFGGSLKKEIFTDEGYAVYEQQHAIYGEFNFRYHVDEQKYQEMIRFSVKPGDLIVSCSGTMGKITIIPDDAPAGIINQALLKLTPRNAINNKYLKYCFEDTISGQMNSNARGGAIKNVASVAVLKNIEIQVPPLEEQHRIVSILDRFDALCNDLTQGLPAEIEARRKQYEYYRDKLLSFKVKA